MTAEDEFVLEHAVRDVNGGSSRITAPKPLLPNYGMGRIRLYEQDVNMMSCVNSMERTLEEFIKLGSVSADIFLTIF